MENRWCDQRIFPIKLIIITLQAYKMARPQFTTAQRVFIVNVNGIRVPTKSLISDIRETVLNLNKMRSGRPRTARNPANVARVQRAIRQNPRVSARRNPLHMDKLSFNRITRELGFHPYRIQTCHGLIPGDHQRRLNYSRWLVQ